MYNTVNWMQKIGKNCPKVFMHFKNSAKEPLTDAEHVRNALARFDQVKEVSDGGRDLAFANILKAARHFGVTIEERNWHQLGQHS